MEHPVNCPNSFPQDQRGTASCASIYHFFSGTFLLTMAGTLLSSGAWCFLVRLPMIHLARGPSRIVVVLSGYIFAAGALTLPVSCIVYREHNVTTGRRTLLPVRRRFAVITSRSDCTSRAAQLSGVLYVFQRARARLSIESRRRRELGNHFRAFVAPLSRRLCYGNPSL